MKTLVLLIGVVLIGTITVSGQNYIGMSQAEIISTYGNPDEIGDNYIVYTDQREDGTNAYYFDKNKNCITFVLVRTTSYYNAYKEMLEDQFTKTAAANTYVRKTKNVTFMAELIQSAKEMQLRIQKLNVNSNIVSSVEN